MSPSPSVWDGYNCKACRYPKVICRGYCARCYRQVARGKEPVTPAKPSLKGNARVVLKLPKRLLAELRKVAGRRGLSVWVIAAIERRLAAGPEHSPALASDVTHTRGHYKKAPAPEKPAQPPASLPNGARTLASYRAANGRLNGH